jgi:flagellar biogenesis protein FliO
MAGLHHFVLLAGVLFLAPVMGEVPAAKPDGMADSRTSNTIPFKQDEGITATSVARLAVVVLIAVALAFVAIYALKRFYFGQRPSIGAGRINVIEAKRLGPRTMLILVVVDSTAYLLFESPNGVAVTRHDDSIEEHEDAG